MLPKKAKVSRELAKHIRASGKNFYGAYMTLRTVKIKKEQHTFSFIVSKKVTALATERNILKRRGYAIIATLQKDILPHTAALFFVKKEAAQASFSDLEKDIKELLVKSKILR